MSGMQNCGAGPIQRTNENIGPFATHHEAVGTVYHMRKSCQKNLVCFVRTNRLEVGRAVP